VITLTLQKLPGPALCAQSDPEQWFPKNETPEASRILPDVETESANAAARKAKAVCLRCTVRVECLQEAMVNKIDHGIWGGLSVKERRRLRKVQK
jgi:WhiB family redox-sensing transcriptional regulator